MIKKTISLAILLSWLAFSIYLGQIMFETFNETQHRQRFNPLFSHFAIDITIIVLLGLFNFFWNNLASFDAYYSLFPIIRLVLLNRKSAYVIQDFNLKNFLLTTVITLWGLRLFGHIFKKWQGFPHQDERFTEVEFKYYSGIKRIFFWLWQQPFVGFLNGLLISFLTLPLTTFYTRDIGKILEGEELTFYDLVGFGIALYGLAFTSVADMESQNWAQYGPKNQVNASGLRKYLRYPQYCGELIFWFGIWVICQVPYSDHIVTNFAYWPIGWVVLLFWFYFLTTFEDVRKSKMEGWAQYKNKVRSALVPIFRL